MLQANFLILRTPKDGFIGHICITDSRVDSTRRSFCFSLSTLTVLLVHPWRTHSEKHVAHVDSSVKEALVCWTVDVHDAVFSAVRGNKSRVFAHRQKIFLSMA